MTSRRNVFYDFLQRSSFASSFLAKMRFLVTITLLLCVASAINAIPAVHLQKALKSVKDDGGQIYVLLVAGSNTWGNYRHQVRHYAIYTSPVLQTVRIFI